MLSMSGLLQLSCKFVSYEAEDLGIALRTKAPCSLTNTTAKYQQLKQDVDSCSQHIEGEWNSNSGIFFVPNSVPNRRKFPAVKLLALLFLCSPCGNVDCRLHRTPHNVAVTVGKEVFMSCASSNTVNPCQDMVWTHSRAHTFVSRVICKGDNVSPLVSKYISIVRTNDGNCTLKIKTQASAEGKYECVSTTTSRKESASLIILADYSQCIVKMVVNETGTGEYSNITCSMEYFGDWAPTMEWITMTGQNSTSINSYESYTSNQIVSAILLIPRNVSAAYMCIMKFTEQGRKTATTATNVPNHKWMSPTFGLITLVVVLVLF